LAEFCKRFSRLPPSQINPHRSQKYSDDDLVIGKQQFRQMIGLIPDSGFSFVCLIQIHRDELRPGSRPDGLPKRVRLKPAEQSEKN